MKTHTPGPWHVQADPQWAVSHPNHDHRFITCGNPDITSDDWERDPNSYIIAAMRDCQNLEANARLIAAAPDLLEALRGLEQMGSIAAKLLWKSDKWEEFAAAIQSARAALKKAGAQ